VKLFADRLCLTVRLVLKRTYGIGGSEPPLTIRRFIGGHDDEEKEKRITISKNGKLYLQYPTSE
jgi:hypothetical protein